MNLDKIKQEVKAQFKEISDALFHGTISFQEIDETKRVYAEASPMFSRNILRYSESNFEYFYILQKYLCNIVDLRNLTLLQETISKLKLEQDLLSMSFLEQISSFKDKSVNSPRLFLEYNYILHLFVYLHECGHLNQEVKVGKETKEANHFSEFNADYFALSKILQYYYSMKSKMPGEYWKRVLAFENEHNFIRLVIVNALLVIYLEVLPKFNLEDTETHPSIKKRLCYLVIQSIEQIKDNFQSLFITDTINDFMVDIFNTMKFIERNMFDTKTFIFDNLLNYCISNTDEIKKHLGDDTYFERFNS